MQPHIRVCDPWLVDDAHRAASRHVGRRRSNRPGLRLGIGTGVALAKIAVASCFSVLLVLAFTERWNVFFLITIAIGWAAVVAGLIIVPIVASFIADSLGQHGLKGPIEPPDRGFEFDSWAQDSLPPTYPPAAVTGIQDGLMARPLVRGMAAGFDWPELVSGVAARLETVLGEGYRAEAEGAALVLRYGPMVRKVSLRATFQPPPMEVSDRALRGCLKMMDEAQMFTMRVRQGPWPRREGANGTPGNLPRPRVRLDDGEIRMVWADNSGTVLRLRPLPFSGSSATGRNTPW